MLAYEPETLHRDGKWHKINVKLQVPKRLRKYFFVDARQGYYAGGE